MNFLNELLGHENFTWPNSDTRNQLKEVVLKQAILDNDCLVYSDDETLMRPGLLTDFDKAGTRLIYNEKDECYHLFKEPNPYRELYARGFKKPDFIFKTGPNEVTLIEVKVCWESFLNKYFGWFTYNIDKSSSLHPEETIHSYNYDSFNLVRSKSLEPLKTRAEEQAFENASLLREILPSSVTVKCGSFVAIQDKKDDISFQWNPVYKIKNK